MNRLYESSSIADAYLSYRPSPPQELVNRVLQYCSSVNEEENKLDLLIDVGCGSGQSCIPFQPYFKRIIGIDVSLEQLKRGKNLNVYENITLQEGCAESLPARDGTVDLIIAGSAAHWFDLQKFFTEAKRVLKPNGSIAIFSLFFHKVSPISREKEPLAFKSVSMIKDMCIKGIRDDPAQKQASMSVLLRYSDIFEAIPFGKKERVDDIHYFLKYSMKDMAGMIKSNDCYETFRKKSIAALKLNKENMSEEERNRVDLAFIIVENLKQMWNLNIDISSEKKILNVDYNYFLLLAKN